MKVHFMSFPKNKQKVFHSFFSKNFLCWCCGMFLKKGCFFDFVFGGVFVGGGVVGFFGLVG
jgi:hypothetical protein